MILPYILLLFVSGFANESILREIETLGFFEKAAILDLDGNILRKFVDFNLTQDEAFAVAASNGSKPLGPLNLGGTTFRVFPNGPGLMIGWDAFKENALTVARTNSYIIVFICASTSPEECFDEAWKYICDK